MRCRYICMASFILCTLLLGGCLNMSISKDENNKNTENMNAYEKEHYIKVQEYTGDGFTLRDANPKTGEIAEKNREEVVAAVEEFFLNHYKTDVKVRNIVSAVDGVSVFVESVGEPHFYTFAIVPIDIKNGEVRTDEVWSQEGQVENAIQGGLYVMAHAEKFEALNEYVENLPNKHPITGLPLEVIEKVKGNGYTTPHYFISTFDDAFDDLFEMYMKNPDLTIDELTSFFNEHPFEPEGVSIAIDLYMTDENKEPDEQIYDQIFEEIKQINGIPKGEYYLFLNDAYIDAKRASGKKENTIDKAVPGGILKE